MKVVYVFGAEVNIFKARKVVVAPVGKNINL